MDATRDAQMVLSAVTRTFGKFGAVHVCDIVAGARTAKIKQFGHDELPTYGVGKDKPKSHWRGVLDALVATGKLQQSRDQFPVPQMTDDGRAVMSGKVRFLMNHDKRIEPEKAKRGGSGIAIDFDEDLFEYLRTVRKEVADTGNVPPYVVFSDRTLKEMSAYMPSSSEGFVQLHGVGESKLEKFGKRFLAEIQQYISEHPEVVDQRISMVTLPPVTAQPRTKVKRGMSETFQITLEMVKQGMSAEAIATQRSLGVGTIEGHIARWIEEGEDLNVAQFVSESVEAEARKLFAEHGLEAMKPIFEGSEERVSYGQAKIICAVIQRELGE